MCRACRKQSLKDVALCETCRKTLGEVFYDMGANHLTLAKLALVLRALISHDFPL